MSEDPAHAPANAGVLFEHLAWGAAATARQPDKPGVDPVARFGKLSGQTAWANLALTRQLHRRRWKQQGADFLAVLAHALRSKDCQTLTATAAGRRDRRLGHPFASCQEAAEKVSGTEGTKKLKAASRSLPTRYYHQRISQLARAVLEGTAACLGLELAAPAVSAKKAQTAPRHWTLQLALPVAAPLAVLPGYSTARAAEAAARSCSPHVPVLFSTPGPDTPRHVDVSEDARHAHAH